MQITANGARWRFYALVAMACMVTAAASEPPRPKIALVLSGGGARGGAHLGVLKVLEDLHVPIDLVVGTSAGAIVGAAYASGMPVAEIEAHMRTLSTATLFNDLDRAQQPMLRKRDDERAFVGPEVGIGADGLKLPSGALAGVSLEAMLRRLTIRQSDPNFDRLPIPFRAVATDVVSSEMVVLGHGSLSNAIRASMAIPVAVTPIEIDGRLLVDGGVARNLPVDVARSLGADVVIAVNIGTPLLRREQIVSLLSVADQMMRAMTARNVAQSIKELGPHDVLITPNLSDVSNTDFDHLENAATAGKSAALAAAESLAPYRLKAADYTALVARRSGVLPQAPVRIDEVRVVGTQHVNPQAVRAELSIKPGSLFDETTADSGIKRVYASGDFERVGYYLDKKADGKNTLIADVGEKSWGPQFLRFGLGLSTDFEGNSFFNALVVHRAPWLNGLGGEWRNDLQIGRVERLRTEWFQPVSPARRWFTAAHAEVVRDPFDLYLDDTRIARLRREQAWLGVDLGAPLGSVGEFRTGWRRGKANLANDVSLVPPSLLPSDDIGGLTLELRADTLDSLRFPRSGYLADLQLQSSRRSLGASSDYTKYTADMRFARSWGPHTLRGAVSATDTLDSAPLPAYELSSLGGFLQLSGYRTGQFVGRGARFGRIVYNYRINGPGFMEGMFAGVSAEAGRIGESVNGSDRPTTLFSNAIYLAMDTPLGPLHLAYGRAGSANQAVYLFIGQP